MIDRMMEQSPVNGLNVYPEGERLFSVHLGSVCIGNGPVDKRCHVGFFEVVKCIVLQVPGKFRLQEGWYPIWRIMTVTTATRLDMLLNGDRTFI